MKNTRRELLQQLAETMTSVIRRVHAGRSFKFTDFTLRPSQVRILFLIAKQKDDVAVKDLAGMLDVTPGAVTQFVDGLVEMGLVRREEDAQDRRVIRIKLTELAKSKLKEFQTGYLTAAAQVFDVLSDDEISRLISLLEKVASNEEGAG